MQTPFLRMESPISFKKSLFLFCLGCFVSVAGNSQIRLFMSGGVHQASVKESNDLSAWPTETEPFLKGRTGGRFGIFADVPFHPTSRWSLQPGLFYSSKGNIFEKTYDTTGKPLGALYLQKNTLKVNYIDIPVMIAYRLPLSKKTGFFLAAGPALSVYYSSKLINSGKYTAQNGTLQDKTDEIKGETGKDPGHFRTMYAGVAGAAGFDFGGAILKADYSRGLTDFYTAEYPGSFYHQTVGASLSIRIGRQKDVVTRAPKAVPVVPSKDTTPAVVVAVVPPTPSETAKVAKDTSRKPEIIVDAPIKVEVKEEVIKKLEQIATRVQFAFGSVAINKAYYAELDEIAGLMAKDGQLQLTIEGHTDNRGKAERNKLVSQQRADAIRTYLTEKGVDGSRLKAVGHGQDLPIADNSTEAGRAKNRRVVFKLSY